MQLGERGSRLSGGQRQCIALADAKVLFNEETSSAKDLQFERQFIERLKVALVPEGTVIIATHRQGTLAQVDRRIVIDGGKTPRGGPREWVIEDSRGPRS